MELRQHFCRQAGRSVFGRDEVEIKERFELAQWLLERNLNWIAAAETKAGFVVAIDTALLTGLAAVYDGAKQVECAVACLVTLGATLLCISILFAAFTVRARLTGPDSSLVYFGLVAKMREEDYASSFSAATDEAWLSDLLRQVHRNAQIAEAKHHWTKRSMQAAFVGTPAIAAAVVGMLLL